MFVALLFFSACCVTFPFSISIKSFLQQESGSESEAEESGSEDSGSEKVGLKDMVENGDDVHEE